MSSIWLKSGRWEEAHLCLCLCVHACVHNERERKRKREGNRMKAFHFNPEWLLSITITDRQTAASSRGLVVVGYHPVSYPSRRMAVYGSGGGAKHLGFGGLLGITQKSKLLILYGNRRFFHPLGVLGKPSPRLNHQPVINSPEQRITSWVCIEQDNVTMCVPIAS